MSQEDCHAAPQSNLEFDDAIVLFADMLGFSNQVKAANNLAQAAPLINVLKRFAREFTESADQHELFGRKYWAISDSMIAVWNMRSEAAKVMTEFDAILSQLSGVACAQGLMMVDDRQLVRGGIARGWFKEDSDTIVSPALVQAATIEKSIERPFIGVSHDLYTYFVEHPGRNHYSPEIDPVIDLFIAPCDYTNNRPVLDYFTITLGNIDLTPVQMQNARTIPPGDDRDNYRSQCHSENCTSFVEMHKQVIVDGLANQTGRTREKYAALREHHNERVNAAFKDKTLLIL